MVSTPDPPQQRCVQRRVQSVARRVRARDSRCARLSSTRRKQPRGGVHRQVEGDQVGCFAPPARGSGRSERSATRRPRGRPRAATRRARPGRTAAGPARRWRSEPPSHFHYGRHVVAIYWHPPLCSTAAPSSPPPRSPRPPSPSATGAGTNPVRYPDPDIVVLDKRFAKIKIGNTPIQRLHTGMLWAEGPAWNAVGQLPGLERHPQRRPAPLARGRRPRQRLPQARRQQQRQHLRLRGPADLLRARQPPRRPLRARRQGHRPGRQVQGKPLNAPNDVVVHPDGGIWFTDPGYGILRQLRGQQGHARDQGGGLPRSTRRPARSTRSPTSCSSPTASASRPTTRSSTSPTPAPRTTRRRRRTSGSTTSSTARRCANGKRVRPCDGHAGQRQARLGRRHPRRRRRQHLGRRRLGRRGLRRRPRLRPGRRSASARSCCPRSAPTSASAAPSATACS